MMQVLGRMCNVSTCVLEECRASQTCSIANSKMSPLEALRYFCSRHLPAQAWLDSEPLFEAVSLQIGESSTAESSSVPLAATEQAPDRFMVMDVESIGLHGEGFAVGWVVITRSGVKLDEGCISCYPDLCEGTDDDRKWVRENVPGIAVTSPTKQHLRNHFWHEWRSWAEQGAVLVADCSWPVESNFLSACVRLNPSERRCSGPYPLHDLASIVLAQGGDPLVLTERLPDELPTHNPLMDARHSARQLVSALKGNDRLPRAVFPTLMATKL